MLEADEERVSAAIEAMEQERVIVRYGAKVDWQKLDEERKVFANITVSVTPERDYGFDKVAARIARYPEVHSLYLLSGGHDLEVVIEGDSMRISRCSWRALSAAAEGNSTLPHFVLQLQARRRCLIGEARPSVGDLAVVTAARHVKGCLRRVRRFDLVSAMDDVVTLGSANPTSPRHGCSAMPWWTLWPRGARPTPAARVPPLTEAIRYLVRRVRTTPRRNTRHQRRQRGPRRSLPRRSESGANRVSWSHAAGLQPVLLAGRRPSASSPSLRRLRPDRCPRSRPDA